MNNIIEEMIEEFFLTETIPEPADYSDIIIDSIGDIFDNFDEIENNNFNNNLPQNSFIKEFTNHFKNRGNTLMGIRYV